MVTRAPAVTAAWMNPPAPSVSSSGWAAKTTTRSPGTGWYGSGGGRLSAGSAGGTVAPAPAVVARETPDASTPPATAATTRDETSRRVPNLPRVSRIGEEV